MQNRLLLILFFCAQIVFAQQERNNWFMGTYLGMNFSASGMKVIPANTTPSYAPYASASYSHPVTGQLAFYSNGSYVYNRNHQQMPNGFYINDETYGIHAVVVPHPGNPYLFYIISSASSETKLYYAVVDMRLQGGLGDVTVKGKLIDDQSDLPFCVVKQYYDNGYWVITHTAGTNQFKSYRITPAGLEAVPVISNAGEATPSGARFAYGKMISNAAGDRFVFTHGWQNVSAVGEEFSFDKACGKVGWVRTFRPYPLQAQDLYGYPAYSPDGSKLYISWMYMSGQTLLVQYDLKAADPVSAYTVIKSTDVFNGDLQLAPDGKIYVSSSENNAVTAKVSVIENPNAPGAACNYRDKAVVLAGNSPSYFTEHFPQFIMDFSTPRQGYEKSALVFKNTCEGQPVELSVKNTLQADSLQLDLGDGTIVKTTPVIHTYGSYGNFAVTLTWWVCGNHYSTTDTLKLRRNPVIDLGADTTLCFGTLFQLNGTPQMEEYRWSTGDSSQSITVKLPGTYSLKLRDGNCWSEDQIKVGYFDQLWTTLGDEYFICEDDQELVKLDAGEDFSTYKWMPTGDTTQWIIVGDVGEYFVVVNDFRGCKGEDGTKVKRRCPVTMHFPNVFTPNNDGVNDRYVPAGKDIVSFNMRIFNRWGQLVFESDNPGKTWDGFVNGKAANADVYVYTSTYTGYINKRLKEFVTKGSFTLMR